MSRILRALQSFFGFTHDTELEARLHPVAVQIEYYFSDQNLENDEVMKAEIAKNQDRWVDVAFIADFPRMRINNITPEEIIMCAQNSPYLEADPIHQRIRSVKPFESDPRRKYRIIFVQGINTDAELELQRKFFDSIFHDVRAVRPFYKIENKALAFSGKTYVELSSEEEAKEAVEKGIEFDGGVLKVELLADLEEKRKEEKQKSPKKSPRKERK